MQILTVDVGTGTQDVLLFDSERELENCFKLVLPSPTMVIADRVRAATAARKRLVLTGVTMGGGPSHWATMDHVRAGLEAFATPGAAPPGFSDRVFRFDYLRDRLSRGLGLGGFAFTREAVPPAMTRLRAVANTAPSDLPLLLMDTAPAAVAGALEDARVRASSAPIVANVGNFHCLAFHLVDGQVTGLFEHHTGELSSARLAAYVEQLADGTISN